MIKAMMHRRAARRAFARAITPRRMRARKES
jgi:hypothetical protein